MYTERLLDARRPAARQQRLCLAVGRISADKNDLRPQLWPVFLDPVMYFRPIHRARHANVGDHPAIFSASELLQTLRAR